MKTSMIHMVMMTMAKMMLMVTLAVVKLAVRIRTAICVFTVLLGVSCRLEFRRVDAQTCPPAYLKPSRQRKPETPKRCAPNLPILSS